MLRTIVVLCTLLALFNTTWAQSAAGQVNLYSYRQPFLIQPILDAFTQSTGIQVNVVFAENGLIEKIKAAGANNPADAVLTVDIGRLDALVQADLLQPVQSAVLDQAIPEHLRHPQGLWFGLTTRARVLYVHKDRVAVDDIKTLADLADPKFKGRLCTRSGKHVYNVGTIASIIAHDGQQAAQQWLQGVKANLARKPQGNDRAQAKAIYEGVCDIAIANHYYMGQMAFNEENPEQKAWADAIRVVFLNQQDRGQHVNISDAGLIKNSPNQDNAVKLLEFLVSDAAQSLYATLNFEYPVKPGIATHPYVESFGSFKVDSLSLDAIAQNRTAASQLVDTTGFDL